MMDTIIDNKIAVSYKKLKSYCEKENFKGYDLIDVLNSKLPLQFLPSIFKTILSQLHLRSPLNYRKLLGIKKEHNSMSVGVLLSALSIDYNYSPSKDKLIVIDKLFGVLMQNVSQGFSGNCWGNNFDWASSSLFVPKNYPNLVTTAKAASGIYEYYLATKSKDALEALISVEKYIKNDLPKHETDYGICISYTDLSFEACYNATMLGSEILSKIYSITKDVATLELAKKSVDFTLYHQHKDGRWNYSLNIETGVERPQVDFHQGYVLQSLNEFVKHSGLKGSYVDSLLKGAAFYKKHQFYNNGRAFWRYPKDYPIEMHHQAVGIITFAKLSSYNNDYLAFSKKIAEFSIDNFQDKKGCFYFRKYKYFTNKISYMRWVQSFTLLALSILNNKLDNVSKSGE